jgi:hypothetical protein
MSNRVRIDKKARQTSGLLKPKRGERPGGREKGQPNKVTRLLKDAILMAGEASGVDGKGKDGLIGYLVWLSRREPAVYGRLLEKLLPYQLTGKDGGPVQLEYKTKAEVIQRMRDRGLPIPPSLTDVPEYKAPTETKH